MVEYQQIYKKNLIYKCSDHFVSRFRTVIDACPAQRRDIVSLHNWVKGTGSINQEEASFLRHEKDLMNLRTQSDETQSYLETCLVRTGVKISRALRKVRPSCKELVVHYIGYLHSH